MGKQYKAIFLLPLESRKRLTEYGWEFDSQNKISSDVTFHLLGMLKMVFLKSRNSIDYYEGKDIEALIFKSEVGEGIESIYFKLYGGSASQIAGVLSGSGYDGMLEIFDPDAID